MSKRLLQLMGMAVLLALSCFGQTGGDINGVVTDASGGLVVNATVTVTNPQTNFRRASMASSSAGSRSSRRT